MKKRATKIMRFLLRRVIKIESIKVYDFENRKEVEANYLMVLGVYVLTFYN